MMIDPQSYYQVDHDHSVDSYEVEDKTYDHNIELIRHVWSLVDEAEREVHCSYRHTCTQMANYLDDLTSEIEKSFDIQNKTLEQLITKIRSDNERLKFKKTQKLKDLYARLMNDHEQRKQVNLSYLNKEIDVAKSKQAEITEFVRKNLSQEPVQLNVGGTQITVGRDTLTSVKDSMLNELFSGKANLSKKHGDQVFIDRDPVIFNHMINYLRSDCKFLPRDLSPDERKHLEIEMSFWKVGEGHQRSQVVYDQEAKIKTNHTKLVELLNDEPQAFNTNKPFLALDTWRKLRPLMVEDILMFSEKALINEESNDIEIKEIQRQSYKAIGQFKKGTSTEEGIVRIVSQNNQIQEGYFSGGKLNGYGRVCYQHGDYYIGMYKNYLRNGHGKLVRANGQVQEGQFKDNDFIGA